MKHINILSMDPYKKFNVQWDQKTYPPTEYDIQFDSTEDIEWDVVAVYENLHLGTWEGKCRDGGLIYISGEPPKMHPLPRKFTDQFDVFVGPHPQVKHQNKILTHGFLNWSLGFGFFSKQKRYTFNSLRDLEIKKTKAISIVTSTKRMMPGHNLRQNVIARLKKDFGDKIDFFGVGERDVDFKADALLPYYFHICMENCEVKDYWTEKFSDPVLAHCIPIYCGCPNMKKYFDESGIISFSFTNYKALHKTISDILQDPLREYARYSDGMLVNKDRIMEKENLIPFLIGKADENKSGGQRYVHIDKLILNPKDFAFMKIRIMRRLQKILINSLNLIRK